MKFKLYFRLNNNKMPYEIAQSGQTLIRIDEKSRAIDNVIVDLIVFLNSHQFHTRSCCSGSYEDHHDRTRGELMQESRDESEAYIEFKDVPQARLHILTQVADEMQLVTSTRKIRANSRSTEPSIYVRISFAPCQPVIATYKQLYIAYLSELKHDDIQRHANHIPILAYQAIRQHAYVGDMKKEILKTFQQKIQQRLETEKLN